MTMRAFLKTMAWVTIIGGLLGHPLAFGFVIYHHLQPQHIGYEGYIVPEDLFYMIFGMIGSVTGGAMLLILLDIQRHVRPDTNPANRF